MINDVQEYNMGYGRLENNFNTVPNYTENLYTDPIVGGRYDLDNNYLTQAGSPPHATIESYSQLENIDNCCHIQDKNKERKIINKRSFYNNNFKEIELIEETGNGRINRTPLAMSFIISNVTNIQEYGDPNIKYVCVSVITDKLYSTIMTYKDYINEHFYQNLKWIKRCPGCTKKQINDLIYNYIEKVPKQNAKIYPRQGFIKVPDDYYVFGAYSEKMGAYAEVMSDSVKMKKLTPIYRETKEIIERWLEIYASHPNLKFIGLISIAAKLLFLLEETGLYFKPIITVSPSTDIDEEKLKAMLYSFDIKNYPVPLLALSEKGLLAYLNQIWDSPAVFLDTSFLDEAASIEEPLRNLIKASRGDYGEGYAGRNIIAVISGNAGYIAHRISPESVIPIPMEGITLDYSSEYISRVTSEMESLVIETIINNINEVSLLASNMVNAFKAKKHKYQNDEAFCAAVYLMMADCFLRELLNLNFATSEELNQIINGINSQRNELVDSDTAILRDFAKVASKHFRSGSFKAIRKKNGMVVDDTGKTAIISGNRLYLTGEMIAELLSQMSTTHNMKALLNALFRYNALDAKDGFTHPLDAHISSGEAVRLYLYDISADILDADVIYMLQNPETAAFLLTKAESKIAGFMPLISDKSGKIAGKRFVYNDAENESIAIYGQAGEGKSYTKHQIMASRFAQGYDILVFDTSDSDTYEALCANLSKRFVDENVVFHKLDDSELHVNIFNIDRTASIPSQKKELVGIIAAALGDLSVPQTNALRSACSELLEKTGVEKSIFHDDLLKLLNKEGGTYESLRKRLCPLIEDINEYGLISGTWKEIFDSVHKIHIVQINEGFSENGNQIVDALLALLFNYKRENPQRPLSVFIDEVQNQNFSTSSPIRKILKEGRKHHLSIVAATQDFYARGSEIGSALGKAGMQIHHCPTQNSANLVAAELRWNKADMARFDSMNRGDIVVKGALYNKENERNMQTILSGHVVSFLSDSIIDEPEEDAEITDDDC